MLVVISTRGTKKNKYRVYHKLGCMYAKQIKGSNRLELDEHVAEKKHMKECKYCAGLRGDVRSRKSTIAKWEEKYQIKFDYDKTTDTLYIATEIGFWKVFRKEYSEKYYLYHRNEYTKDMNLATAKRGEFHRQNDLKLTASLDKIVDYIVSHDRAKVIIMDDYRKLPRTTKKQKYYYQAAARKKRKQDKRRVFDLFAALESADSELKMYSFC